MRYRLLVPLFAAVCVTVAGAEPPAQQYAGRSIQEWVDQLGSANFTQRERATRILDDIGAPALGAVRRATKSSDNEKRQRAGRLLPRLELLAETERLLAPTRVRLNYHDTPLADVLADLARQSGYSMGLDDKARARLATQKVTLQTGDATFWQAYDQLCRTAGLVETSQQTYIGPSRRETRRATMGAGVLLAMAPPTTGQTGRILATPSRKAPPPRRPPRILFLFTSGKPVERPTFYDGALRIQVDSVTRDAAQNPRDIAVNIAIQAEPRVAWRSVTGVDVDEASDELGQRLLQIGVRGDTETAVANADPSERYALAPYGDMFHPCVRLHLGAKEAKSIQKLRFALYARVIGPGQKKGHWGNNADEAVLVRTSFQDLKLPR